MENDDYRDENPEQEETQLAEEGVETEESETEGKDWEAEAKKWQAIAQRAKKKLDNDGDKSVSKEVPSQKPSDLDYGMLAFHNTKQDSIRVEDIEDIEFLKQTMSETGKSQDSILNSKWFALELKERQESRASRNAVPKGKTRSGQPITNSLDEAMAVYKETGQFPDDFELRNKLIDKLTDKENTSMFNGPSVGPI